MTIIMPQRVAFQGAIAAYSHIACSQLTPDAHAIGYATFDETFHSLLNRETDLAVIPIENSIGGPVERVFKDWIRSANLWVSGELYLPVELCLLATHSDMSKIKTVYSHEHAIKQCLTFLRENTMSGSAEYGDTAISASMVADMNDPSCAAIASREAAEYYGLKIVEPNIQDFKNNYTRFWLYSPVGSVPIIEENKRYKTSLVFRLKHEPGTLHRALSGFQDMGINLTKIDSFFDPHTQTTPEFWLDAEAHMNDQRFQRALDDLRHYSQSDSLRILGCYECTKPDLDEAPSRSLADIAKSVRRTHGDFKSATEINPKLRDHDKYYKTRLLFKTPHCSGSLAKALNAFKPNDVELTLIESFTGPDFRMPHFLVEFEGHCDDENARNALKHLADYVGGQDNMEIVDTRETNDPSMFNTLSPGVSLVRDALSAQP